MKWWHTIDPCVSVYFNWRNPKKATELIEEALPVHNKSNIKLNTSMRWSFMFITCKISAANLKLIENLIIWPDTSNLSVAISANRLHYRIMKLLDWSSYWLSACFTNGIISVESRHMNFNSYIKVEKLKTNLMSLIVFISLIFAQHVSNINMSIFRSLRLWWWITTSVILFSYCCVLGFAAGDAW